MSSEIRRTSADDPGETAATAPASDNQAIHGANPTMSRRMLADLPDYDGEVPPPLEGADPGNEDAGEPAETTGLGDGHHSPDELRAWLGRNAGDDPARDEDDPAGNEDGPAGDAGDGPGGDDGDDGDGPGPDGDNAKPGQTILHAHSTFKDQSLDLYSDGKNWASGEMIQARIAEAKEKERPRPLGPDDIGALRQRDFGDNTVGENPAVQLGDTRDRRTFGEKLREEDSDPDQSRLQRLITKAYREAGSVNDGLKNEIDNIRNALARPQPTGHAEVPVRHTPAAVPKEGHGGANPDSVAQLIVVGTIMGIEIFRWGRHKVSGMVSGMRRRHDASHG